ncbi:TFIIB-type zinc ribbon-containing protein [Lachnospiraceae bacterium 62-35]
MSVITYKCPNCGGDLQFEPKGQNLKCEYCLSEFSEGELEKEQPAEYENTSSLESENMSISEEEAVTYFCPSCGAEIITNETTAASICFYCHNPIVLTGRLSGELRPDYVIPFSIDRKQAEDMFVSWIKHKLFLPRTFFSTDAIEKISGVYLPYLLYSCKAKGSVSAECENVRTWVRGDIQYTETKRYQVDKKGSMNISKVMRNALRKSDKRLAEGVLPYNMETIKPFTMNCLPGFMAEMKDMEGSEFEDEIKKEITDYAHSSLMEGMSSYAHVSVKESEMHLTDNIWEYALFPVWLFTYQNKSQNRMYYFALNGQTGKICGELPIDDKKLALLFAGIFLSVFLLLLIIAYSI